MVVKRISLMALASIMFPWGARAAEVVLEPPVVGSANTLLERALNSASPGDRIVLRAGEYRLDLPLRFPRGGGKGRPITLCAAAGEYVALLGSVRLRGWERHRGRIWKVPHPPKPVKGLYEDAERLTHPRPHWGTREDPPVSELKAPGTWTQDGGWVYLWSREGDSPDRHRIEASQCHVVHVNQPWIRVEGLHLLFGQNVVCRIMADNCEVVDCEIAHCSNSVDNSYNAYFSGCSNSAFRRCLVHDSYYWGDHGSNSHTMSAINCGDGGPNVVDGCEIFNGGLGVGSKGAVRRLVVTGCRIYDQVSGVAISGERSSGPGAGKADRGHYLVWHNHISDCRRGVWISSGKTHGDRVWGNLIEGCGAAVRMRNVGGVPDRPHLANNIFRGNDCAVYLVAGRDGTEKISTFVGAGLRSHHNIFDANGAAWRTPLTWSRNLDLSYRKIRDFKDLGLERGSSARVPQLDRYGRSTAGCPAVGRGAALPLPSFLKTPPAWHIGLGPRGPEAVRSERGLTLSIAGSPGSVAPGEQVHLRAVLKNEHEKKRIAFGEKCDLIVTFHFRYLRGHRDKQELYRVRVALPNGELGPGEVLDLTALTGWKNPVNGALGDPFHLRVDTDQWRRGCRLRATARRVARDEETRPALQRLTPLLRSREVLHVEFRV